MKQLLTFGFLLLTGLGCRQHQDGVFSRSSENLNYSLGSCAFHEISATPLHEKHLRFARLLALSLNASESLRRLIRDVSQTPGQLFFNEILVSELLAMPLDSATVETRLWLTYSSRPDMSDGQSFQDFKTELLAADPLLVLKIPDWLARWEWDVQKTVPHVLSNRKGAGQLLYGFTPDGECYSKADWYEFSAFELLVKTSEDYLWIEGPDFLKGFADFCLPYPDFFAQYARPYAGHYLLKKRDMQSLFLGCSNGPEEPAGPPTSECPRDDGFDHNYLLGFQVSSPGIFLTLQNQPCLGGEETFDFQLDFLYAARTGEETAADLQLPPLALYGVRLAELAEYQIIQQPGSWIFSTYKVEVKPKYYALNLGSIPEKFNYMAQINPERPEWVADVIGQALYVTWNETDFEMCTAEGVSTVTNTTGLTLNLGLKFSWLGKKQNPNAVFNTSYTKVSQHKVSVTGASVIPLGYNALGYCDAPTPGVPPARWYPTGPQALAVHYDFVLD